MARPALNDNARYAYRYYIEKHKLQPYQAAGIVGNLMQESTMNTGARNRGDGRDGTDSVGIGQWNGDRARALHAYAGDNVGNLDTQLDFVLHEMQNGRESAAYKQLMDANDVHGATSAMISYERPAGWSAKNPTAGHGFDNRLAWAGELMGLSPEEIASASPKSEQLLAQANNQTITKENAGKPYNDGVISYFQNKANPDTAPKQPTVLPVDIDGKAEERGLVEKITGKKMPESLLGVKTSKGIDMLTGLGTALTESTDDINKQIQTRAAAGGRRDSGPIQMVQNPADLQAQQDQLKKLKPWELLMAMKGNVGGLGGLGGIRRV